MKNIIILLIASMTTISCAVNKTFQLDYKPSGQIVRFEFDSLTIYSDTSAVFAVVDNYDDHKYSDRTRTLIMNKINESKQDTITFLGHFIPFNDSIENKYQKDWYIDFVVLKLADRKKLMIIDKNNNSVTKIKKKKIIWDKDGYGMVKGSKISYTNKDTGEELFSKFLEGVIVDPPF